VEQQSVTLNSYEQSIKLIADNRTSDNQYYNSKLNSMRKEYIGLCIAIGVVELILIGMTSVIIGGK